MDVSVAMWFVLDVLDLCMDVAVAGSFFGGYMDGCFGSWVVGCMEGYVGRWLVGRCVDVWVDVSVVWC